MRVTLPGHVSQFADGCSTVDCVNVTADDLDVGYLGSSQVCPELFEFSVSDERFYRHLESYTDICVVIAILVVLAPFARVSYWICSWELLGRGRWYLVLALVENILEGRGQHCEDFVPYGLSVRSVSVIAGSVLSLAGTIIAIIL